MKRTALYRHRDRNGTLLYVGISLSVAQRLAQHASTAHWFAEVTQVDIEWLPTRDAALAAERRAIQTEHPRCNVVHSMREKQPEHRPCEDEILFFRGMEEMCAQADALSHIYERAVSTWGAPETSFLERGHRVWLRLTDVEFLAIGANELANYYAELEELATAGEITWREAFDNGFSMWMHVFDDWARKRQQLRDRWPLGWARRAEVVAC